MTILILLLLASAGLRCSADRAGMRNAVGFITGELDPVLSAAADRTGDTGGKSRIPARGMDKAGHEMAGIQHGRAGRRTGGDTYGTNAPANKNATSVRKKEPDLRGGTAIKSGTAGGRDSYAAGTRGTAPVKKNRTLPYGDGSKKDMKSDAVITADNKISAAGKEKQKSLSGSGKKNGPGKTDSLVTADKGTSVPGKKESVSREDAATTGGAINKNADLPDAGKERRPSGYLAKPRVDEPAAQ